MPTDRKTRSFVTPEDLNDYMNEINDDIDYPCDWQGISHEEPTTEPWYIVEHKKRTKRYALWDEKIRLGIASADIPELHPDLDNSLKQSNTDCYKRKKEGRRNHKEISRLRCKLRVLDWNHKKKRPSPQSRNILPHGVEDDYLRMHSGPGGNDASLASNPIIPETVFDTDSPDSEVVSDTTSDTPNQVLESIAGATNARLDTIFEHHSNQTNEPSCNSDTIFERTRLCKLAMDTPAQVKPEDDSDGFAEILKTISDIDCSADLDDWVSHLENIVIMSYQISRASSFSDVFVAVVAYIKMNNHKSALKQIFDLIDEVIKACPAKDIKPNAFSANDVLQHWDLFKSNTIFTKISYLLTAAMSLSICSIKQIEWSPFGLQLVALEAAKQQLKAVDVIDAVVSTFTWLAETGYRVFQEKSLMPLLYADNCMKDFNRDCDYVLANADQALAGNLGEINDFEHKTDEVLRQVCEMKSVQKTGPTALWLQKRYSELVNIKQRIVGKHRNTAIRFAPFGVGITGPSGVGKSTLAKLVMKTALFAMGFSTDPKRIITKDMFDAFDSNYTSDILGMFLDDVGNGKAAFAKVSPTDVIIKFFNNMAAQAVKAELNAKGVVFIAFKVGILTSNFRDYNVRDYSEKPEASLRRFIHTRTRIKPEYRLNGGISLNTEHPDLDGSDLTQDVWELDLEECHIYESSQGQEAYKFRYMRVTLDDGRTLECKDLSLTDYLDVIITLAKRHAKVQRSVMARSNDFDTMEMCEKCCRPEPMCKCKPVIPHAFEHMGEVVVEAATKAVTSYVNRWISTVSCVNYLVGFKPVKLLTTRLLAGEIQHIINETATPWLIALTPNWMFQTTVFTRTMGFWQRSSATYDLRYHMKFGMLVGLGMICAGLYGQNKVMIAITFVSLWFGTMLYWSQHRARIKHYQDEYLRRRDALPDFARSTRDGKLVKGLFVASTLVVGLKLFRLWNKARLAKIGPNALTPSDVDDQPSWFGFMLNKMGMKVETSPVMRCTTTDQLVSAFEKNNLFWAIFTRSDGSSTRCNIFFPRKCVAWFPQHVFYPNSDMTGTPTDLLTVRVERHDRPGGVFTFKCELSTSVTSDSHDLVVVNVPNCPDLKNRIEWLPLTQPTGSSFCQFLVRKGSEFRSERLAVKYGAYGHRYTNFYGGSYNTKLAQDGACMGVLLSDSKTPTITGFHIGGEVGSDYGVMQTVTQDEANTMIAKLESIPGVLLSSNATTIPHSQYGIPLLATNDIHPLCMAASLTKDAYIDILGSTRLRSEQKSSVEKSIISDAVFEATGVPNTWDKPQLRPNWKGYNATLEHIVDPADMFAPSAVERVRQDWLKDLIPLAEDLQPLTDKEAIMGIDGARFVDALPMNTGAGFPIYGKKSKHFTDVMNEKELLDRIPSDAIVAERQRLRDCWTRNERAYPVSTATLKDEPTVIGKEKVRVFQAGAVAISLEIRKYFLPVARFLSLHPCESESAVGVNAFSTQWEFLMAHANKFADDDRVIAWDYSKYDVRMNSQITRAVFMSFIDLAEAGGYPTEAIATMKAMVTDIVHPLIDYNGTMIMAYNMNTSGNNVTVNVNSTAGSFYVRLGFFNEYPHVSDFRSKVAALTYGDDFKGSVHPDYRQFNFISYKSFLGSHGMKITLPDKSDKEVAFMKDPDADFLKRQTNFISEINCGIGRLDEASIFKSLHSNLKSKTTTKIEVSASCIETAMHEWFAHGKDVYELRQSQMREVCGLTDLPVPAVNVSFQERVDHWLDKYEQN